MELINQTQTNKFENFKKEMKKKRLYSTKVAISDLKLVTEEFLEFKGVTLPISKNAFKDLIAILGLNKKILSNFQEYMSEKAKWALISTMQKGISSAGSAEIYLHATNEKVVERISRNKQKGLSEKNYLETVERVLNDNNNLSINSYAVDSRGAFLNLVNDSNPIGINGFNDETFHFGVAMNNSFNKGTEVNPFNERVICSNGMITRRSMGSFELAELTSESWNSFAEHMDGLQKSDFISPGFMGKVKTAIETPASVAELEYAVSKIKGYSGNDSELFLPYDNMKMKYAAKGIDLETTAPAKKATAQTGQSVWDVCNALTDFASNQYNYAVGEISRNSIKGAAGDLLFKDNFDMNNIMTVNPFK